MPVDGSGHIAINTAKKRLSAQVFEVEKRLKELSKRKGCFVFVLFEMCKMDPSIMVNNHNLIRPREEEYIGIKEGEANYSETLILEAVNLYDTAN